MAFLLNIFSTISNGGSIAGIHDCFLVTAENTSTLLDTLKAVYMEIYIYDENRTKLDALFVHNIEYIAKDNEYHFDKQNRLVITQEGKKLSLPNPIHLDKKDMPDLNTSAPAIE